jgi:CubicO group peptidase (beta-lactamase class C family)
MRIDRLIYAILLSCVVAHSASAQGLPVASNPEEVGFSSDRLKRIGTMLRAEVESGAIPGAVAMISRRGKVVYAEAIGFRDREGQAPMPLDAIFRVASMTKPVVAATAMTLVEEGALRLDATVASYLPEFRDVKVGVEKTDAATGKTELVLEPVARPITVHDLMRHTSGITFGIFGKSMVKQAYLDAGVRVFKAGQTSQRFTASLAKMPLAYQPATTWEYGHSPEVVGRIIEVVTGKGLDEVVAERIANPLKLQDTGWSVPEPKAQRVALPHVDPATGKRPVAGTKTDFPAGGAGMASTAGDFLRFSQMLLNGGELDGARLLSPKTVSYMTQNHLPPTIAMGMTAGVVLSPFGLAPTPELGQGWGLGVAVLTDPGQHPWLGSRGLFYWAGVLGTLFWVDPAEQLAAVLMVQTASSETRARLRALMRSVVYQAIIN